jgi:multiple sugar transport system ATP-binding protein
LYPHMSVRANLEFPLHSIRMARAEVDSRVSSVAERLSLTEFLDRRPRQLSGGQRQRVALGRAMVREPGVFLLDEPLSNLDAQLRVSMRAELKRLHAQLERTFIFVTHDQAEAMTMADRIAVLSGGVLQQVGSPDDIYDRPANVFVAGFMGNPAINLLPARIVSDDGDPGIELAGAAGPLRLPIDPSRLDDSAEGTLGIRSEHLRLVPPEEGDLRGVVSVVELMHPEKFVTVDMDAHSVTVRTSTEQRASVGDTVGLALDRESAHLFGSTGMRIPTAREKARI